MKGMPPDEEQDASRQVRVAEALALRGDHDGAARLARRVLRSAPTRAVHADAIHVVATAEMRAGRTEEALELLASEARLVETAEPLRAATLRASSTNLHFLRFEAEAALDSAYAALANANGNPPALVLLAVAIGETMRASGRADASLDTVAAALRHSGDFELAGPAAWHLVVRERFDDAEELARDALERLDSQAAPGPVALVLRARAELALCRGQWPQARGYALEALGLHRRAAHLSAAAFALVLLARLDAMEGRFAECEAHASEACAFAQATGANGITAAAEAALGLAALGREAPHEAAGLLDRVAATMRHGGVTEPTTVPYAGDHVESLLLAGRGSDAVTALAELEPRAAASGRSFGTAVLWRGRGLLADDADSASGAFGRSLSALEGASRPFEQARTELAFGERLRRARRRGEARGLLRPALHTFEQLGALPWAERARRELRLAEAATSRPKRSNTGETLETLTEQELRAARLAAQGLTNREIASALTVTPKTVEFHLGNVYRKLGVRGRIDIARELSRLEG